MKELRPAAAVSAALALLLVSHAPGVAANTSGVDLELRSGDKVTGTFDPADVPEVFRIRIPSGAKLTVKAKAAKRGAPPHVELLDDADGVTATGAESGPKSTLSVLSIPAGGEYRIVATSRDGVKTGDYSFSCKWVTPTTVVRPLSLPAPGAETTFTFGADRGAFATFDVAAASGSAALPRLLRVRAPDGTERDLGDPEPFAPTDHFSPVIMEQTGDYTVFLDHGGGAGDVIARVTLKPPKTPNRKINVSAKALGPGEGFATGQVLGSTGGVVTVPDLGLGGGLGDITGSSVNVPPGALPEGSAIFVGTATDVDPRGREQDLGPSVQFGPDGAQFDDAVTITIPVDLSAVNGDANLVVIFTRDKNGKVKPVPPPYDFTVPGFVSFPSLHFSAYQAARDIEDKVPTTAQFFTLVNFGAVPTDMAFALDGSDPNRQWYVTVGDRLKEVGFDPSTPATPYVVRDYAGQGTQTVTGTLRSDFQFGGGLQAVTSDSGFVYVGDGPTVWQIDTATNLVTQFLGDGTPEDSGDGGPATLARVFAADDMMVDATGRLLLVDRQAARIRAVDASLNVSTIAGTGSSAVSLDGGFPVGTALEDPRGIAEDPQTPGVFYVAERSRIRVVDTVNGVVSTLAGSTAGEVGCTAGIGGAARFSQLSSVSYDFVLSRVVATDETCHTVVQIDTRTREVSVYAGTPGIAGFTADFAARRTSFKLSSPRSAFALGGTVYVLDSGNQRLRLLIPASAGKK